MKYYDIKAFCGDDLFVLLEEVYCSNDAFFLFHIYSDINSWPEPWEVLPNNEVPRLFRDILVRFYEYFTGDKTLWLHHTMNIVYPFDDFSANLWLWGTLTRIEQSKPITAKEVLRKHCSQIHKRPGSLKQVFQELEKVYGHKWTYYNKEWKKLNKS